MTHFPLQTLALHRSVTLIPVVIVHDPPRKTRNQSIKPTQTKNNNPPNPNAQDIYSGLTCIRENCIPTHKNVPNRNIKRFSSLFRFFLRPFLMLLLFFTPQMFVSCCFFSLLIRRIVARKVNRRFFFLLFPFCPKLSFIHPAVGTRRHHDWKNQSRRQFDWQSFVENFKKKNLQPE